MFIQVNVFTIMKIILIVLLLFVMRCVSKPSLLEMTALQSLYNQTNGNKWNWQPDYQEYGIPWNFTNIEEQNPCKHSSPWQGVSCSEDERNITSLDLYDYNLNGKYCINLNTTNHSTYNFSKI